jgi:hypothetical protein
MSAKELLEQIGKQLEQLPAEEREAFLDGVVNLEQSLPSKKEPFSRRSLQWPDIHARHRQIFGNLVLDENIVLAAREEEGS